MIADFLKKLFEDSMTREYRILVEGHEKKFNYIYKDEFDKIGKWEHELQEICDKLTTDLESISYDELLYNLNFVLINLDDCIKFLATNYKSMVGKYFIYKNAQITRKNVSYIVENINRIDKGFRKDIFESIEEILSSNFPCEKFRSKLLIYIDDVLTDKRLDVTIRHKHLLSDNYHLHEKFDKEVKPITCTINERLDLFYEIIENCISKDSRKAIMLQVT